MGVHTKPKMAELEITHLVQVYDTINELWGCEDAIIAGDFNADCSYVTNEEYKEMRLIKDKRFKWLVNKEEDTTVSDSNCAYDRFVIVGKSIKKDLEPSSVGIFNFEKEYNLNRKQALLVSDHYPIHLQVEK
ncbi:unnamed protein product [Dimorphilus gyrociliatus]|uniref:Uncharacterized protein n=1 Tax=Dimorphilus gyrociliatus TaxID=2664684 RepID=A0A7I8W277_9ANNE|nr:unnamed protein product [Dimorphilus gyrociliatus]